MEHQWNQGRHSYPHPSKRVLQRWVFARHKIVMVISVDVRNEWNKWWFNGGLMVVNVDLMGVQGD
jgi:hypothetical protein